MQNLVDLGTGELVQAAFDYEALDTETREVVQERTADNYGGVS